MRECDRLTIISRSGRVFEMGDCWQVLLANLPYKNRGRSTGHDMSAIARGCQTRFIQLPAPVKSAVCNPRLPTINCVDCRERTLSGLVKKTLKLAKICCWHSRPGAGERETSSLLHMRSD